jgi:hypothetical protein
MPVTILFDKPVRILKLQDAYIAAGYLKLTTRPGEFITIEDTNDTATVRAIYDAHDVAVFEAEDAQAVAARSAILATAQSTVGVKFTDLTAAQIKALMACLLYAAGGVDVKNMTVKPLSEWMQ